ncbi:YncE family protein [Streptomyces sp. NPDC050161]|uniref:YncE family protein n=1 Tax=Streptomyces sp. NPDC050161 TaxID=3365604 RepID=UPI0037AA278E
MSSLTPRIRRIAATAAAVAAGSTLTMTGAAHAAPAAGPAPVAAHSGKATHSGKAVTAAPLAKGLYQSAYSDRNHVLWATASVGRPPVTNSALVKVNPHSMKVKATYTPPVTDAATGAVEAVYGVAVDDKHNTVWTTNTRNNSVAVYSQRTGKHLATLPGVNHAREVVVDERHNTAWASGFGDGSLVAFDTRTYKEKKRVTVEGAGPAGLAVNERTGTAYATDLNGNQIIEASTRTKTPRLIPTGEGPISIALSRDGRTAYTADQKAGSLSVVDLRKGAVTKSVPTGDGTLAVASDPRSRTVLVANRTAATVSLIDPRKGSVVKTVTTGANPNHIEIAHGTAYVVDKSNAGPQGEDQLNRIRVKR